MKRSLLVAPLALVAGLGAGCALWPLSLATPESPFIAKMEHITTDAKADELNPVWSPDGTQIYFVKSRSFDSKYDIMVMDRDGGHQRSVSAEFPNSAWNPVLNADGRTLIFFSNREGNYDIWSMETDGRHVSRLTSNEHMDFFPTWSPKGDRIAFISDRSGEIAVWTMEKDGTRQEQATAGGFGDLSPAWSPDGTKLAFIRRVRTPDSTDEYKLRTALESALDRFLDLPGRTHISHIWIKDLTTNQIRQLTTDEAEDGRPVWSPDGRSILFTSRRNDNRDLYLIDVASGTLRRLTTDPGDDRYPSWSPDGTQIAFASTRSGSPDIWILTLREEALR